MLFLLPPTFFALGAIVASFAGVVAARLNTGQSFLSGRSHCDACGRSLPPSALIPIVSYALSRGRASCCGVRLSPHDTAAELTLGGLFVLAYLKLGITPALPFVLISFSLLLALVLYDLSHQILPSALLFPFVASSAAAGYLSMPPADFLRASFIAALIALSLALIHAVSRGRAMGLADAPLSFGLALLTGPAAFSGFIFSFWIGAVIGIALLFGRPAGSRMGIEVPFAPFLAAGFLLAYFTQWNPFALVAAVPSTTF